MELKAFRELLFKTALESGCSAAETYYADSDSFSVNILNGDIDRYKASKSVGLSLRVKYDGRDGFAFTEVFEGAQELVRRAIDNAKTIEANDEHPMQGKSTYAHIEIEKGCMSGMSEIEKIEYAKKLEEITKAADPAVERLGYCSVDTEVPRIEIHNTLGLEAVMESEFCVAYIEPIMRRGEDVKDSFSWRMGKEAMNAEDIANEGIEKCNAQFNASPVAAGSYRILLQNSVFADLINAFASIFSAEAAQKGLSLLANKEGETIAAESVSLIDDPFMSENARVFDDEGVPTQKKTIIDKGVFKTLLHNLKTAAKAQCATTGNAGRASASSGIDVSPTNLYIAPGTRSYDELVSLLGDGLIITSLSGLHSGTNGVSGDFSLLAKGHLVQNGKIIRSVDQITVAGSFYELLKGIVEIGSDLIFGIPYGMARMGAPSIIIDKLAVAG